MKKNSLLKIFYIFLSVLFLLLSIYGNNQLRQRYKAPFKWKNDSGHVVVTDNQPDRSSPASRFVIGDILLDVNNIPVITGQELEFLFDIYNLDKTKSVSFEIKRSGQNIVITDYPIQGYKNRFIILNLILGLLFWVIGVFIFIKKQKEKATQVFSWGCMILTVVIMTIWPKYPQVPHGVDYSFSAIFYALYLMVPALILYFTMLYPKPKAFIQRSKIIPWLLFMPSFVFIALVEITYFNAIQFKSPEYIRTFYTYYNWFRLYHILYLIAGIGCMIHTYKLSSTKESRNKIQWILWGLCFGIVPFLFLWTLPQILGFSALIPQEVNYIFLTVIPLAFGFSIVRYQVMDIEVVINRSIVYTILTGIIICLYLLVVGTASQLLHGLSQGPSNLMIIVFTLGAAIIFTPIKQRVQKFVDKTFYRIKYNYNLAIQDFGRSLAKTNDTDELIALFIKKINAAIPIKKIVFLLLNSTADVYSLNSSYGISKEDRVNLSFGLSSELVQCIKKNRMPMAKKGKVEFSGLATLPSEEQLDKIDIELLLPMVHQQKLIGFLMLGRKESETRFFEEDMQLFTQMIDESIRALERIKLQESMILERAAKEKLEELNQLKSEFISHVSHELRTPLTSICWSVENMLDGIPEKPSPKLREYLAGIHDCSQHLRRMIENLLDITKIEAGKIEIYPEKLNLSAEVQKSLEITKPMAEKVNIQLQEKISPELIVKADKDGLQTIITNLVSNAVKYAPQGSTVKIETEVIQGDKQSTAQERISKKIVVAVIDEGPGISTEKQKSIFEKFEQVKVDKSVRGKGLGLGLHIVKKLVEIQNGEIWVESERGKGSCFKFTLPFAGSAKS